MDAAVARSLADMEEAVSNVNATNAALTARMNGIAGQATTDTEILDARTAADGTTHANLGEHIRKADEDIGNILDYAETLVSIPDEIRQKNLVEAVNAEAIGTDSTIICRSRPVSVADKAGVIFNGELGFDLGRAILRFTKPMHLEAGKTYTIFIDDPHRTTSGSIFFYVNGTELCMQQGGQNRGFTISTTILATFVPDTTNEYQAGLYMRSESFEDYKIHLYVLEGTYTEKDFLTYAPISELQEQVSRMGAITDYARKNNLVRMTDYHQSDGEGNVIFSVRHATNLDAGITCLDGHLGPTNTSLRISEDIELEQGQKYTIYADDGNEGKNYNVLLADQYGTFLRENGVARIFNILEEPYGQFVAPDSKKYHVAVYTPYNMEFESMPLRVCLLKGDVPIEKIRAVLPYDSTVDKIQKASANAGTLIRIKDELRAKTLVPVKKRTNIDSNGVAYFSSDADADSDPTFTVLTGELGTGTGISSMFAFTEYYRFSSEKEYTVFAMDPRKTLDYGIYFYRTDGTVMQVNGVNFGRSVLTTPLWHFTPDEDGDYRAGIYAPNKIFDHQPLRFLVLEGHYTIEEIRDVISYEEYLSTVSAKARVFPEVSRNALFTTITNRAVADDGSVVFTVEKIDALDKTGVILNGELGISVQRNNPSLTESFPVEAGKTYTVCIDSDRSLDFNIAFANVEDAQLIPMNGTYPQFMPKTKPYGIFVPDISCRAFVRINVPGSMTFDHFRMHLYVLEGEYPLDRIYASVSPAQMEAEVNRVEAKLDEEITQSNADVRSFNAHSQTALRISEFAREHNLIKMTAWHRESADGTTQIDVTPFGRLDPAGALVDGALDDSKGLFLVYASEPFHFEAGEDYTIFIDEDTKASPYAVFFYRVDDGVVQQENGRNRGFGSFSEPFGTFKPDLEGEFRLGFYGPTVSFNRLPVHVYLLKGKYRREVFLGYADGNQIGDSASSMIMVKDWVRRRNLVTCSSRAQTGHEGVHPLRVVPAGAHDRAGGFLVGEMGGSVSNGTIRYSESFHVEAGKTYTVLMTDEDPDADYKLSFLNLTTGVSYRENGAVRMLGIKSEPHGLIAPEADADLCVYIAHNDYILYEHHLVHVYVVEGVYSKAQMLATANTGDSLDYESFGLPVLKLTGSMTGVTKEVTGTFDYIYGDLSGSCTLKWQGGSSLSYPKKNFTVKFDQKFEAKDGWGQRKKYVLKANYIDFSHARNIVCARLWGQVVKSRATRNERLYAFPNGGAIDGFPCIMLLNGEFYGFYTFNTPKDEDLFGIGETTVDPETGEETPLPQAVFCADNHTAATQFKAHCVVDESDFSYKYVPDEEDFQWAKDSLDNLIDACLAADSEEAVDALADKVDLDSAIDYYIFTCLLGGGDMTDKNYIISTYDGVQWFFTAYDMDSVFGNYWTGKYYTKATGAPNFRSYANTHQLMYLIRKYKRTALKARYAELRAGVMSEENVALTYENFMVDIPRAVLNKEVERWPLIPGTTTNNLTQILDWYRLRVIVLDAEIDAL